MRLSVFIPSRRSLKIGSGLLAAYVILTVGYYLLPWSIRKAVYLRAPYVDRALCKSGFNILQGWDELALIGRDVEVRIEGSFRGDFAYGGLPSQGMKVFGSVNVLENLGYVAGYSESMRNPLWVTYRLFDVPKLEQRSIGPRKSRFGVDTRTLTQVAHSDYTYSRFDRGHMAPNYGIATRYGREAQLETFLMSNVIPQNPVVNRHLWKDLEMRVAKRYGRYFHEVWVITGPVFQGEIKKLDSGIPVPSAYYKIIVDEHNDELRALAFMVPRYVPPYTRIKTCLVSIDEIEWLTDLDFFPGLPDDVEAELESERATRLWPWIGPSLRYRLFSITD
jgi:endonuclease G